MASRGLLLLTLLFANGVVHSHAQEKKPDDWVNVLREDPRLKDVMKFQFNGTTDLDKALDLLRTTTGVALSLVNPPKDGVVVFAGASGNGPAWLLMRVLATSNFTDPRWEKVGDGYQLHGKPKSVRRFTKEEEAAAKKRADDEAVARTPFILRKDVNLHPKLTVVQVDPKLADILKLLSQTTGLRLTVADNLKDHEPKFGSVQLKSVAAFAFMEWIAARELHDGRWLKTDDGYRLEGISRTASAAAKMLVADKPLSHWLSELKDPDPLAREEALVVLAGAGEAASAATPMLKELLKDKSAPVRVKAALALGQLKGQTKEALPVLLAGWKDGSRTLRHQIMPLLGSLAVEEEVLLLLLRTSAEFDDETNLLASNAIRRVGSAALAQLDKALEHADVVVRRQAVVHLKHLGPLARPALPALSRMLKDDDWDTRFQAAQALWRIDSGLRTNLSVLVEANAKEDVDTRHTAREVVMQMKPPVKEALPIYMTALKEALLPTKLKAADAVWRLTRNADDVLPTYRAALKDGTPTVKVQAADAIWDITRKADEILPVYREAIENPIGFAETRDAAQRSLDAIQRMGSDAKALRLPMLEILKGSKDISVIGRLPPALARLGPESIPALVALTQKLEKQANQLEQERARAACRTIGLMGKEGLKPMVLFLDHPDVVVRNSAYDALHELGPASKEVLPILQRALKQKIGADRARLVTLLAGFGPDARDALPDLLEIARHDKDPACRRQALSALPHLEPDSKLIRPLLYDTLNDDNPLLRLMAADWLLHLDAKDARASKILVASLTEPSCAYHAFQVLRGHRTAAADAMPVLNVLLDHRTYQYRLWAIITLDRLGVDSKEHRQKLVAALDDPEGLVRLAAARALRKGPEAEQKAAIACLMKSLAAKDKWQQGYGQALGEFGAAAKAAIPVIEREMPLNDGYYRMLWIEAVIAIDPAMLPKWKPTLEEAFQKNWSYSAATLLAKHYPKETKYRDFLVELLQDVESHKRIRGAQELEKLEPKKHKFVPLLIEALRGPPAVDARIRAAHALAELGPAAVDAVPALRLAVRDRDPRVRFAANEALRMIDPKSAMPCVLQGY